jgi:ubiquinone/menaquinone biosynthesis C-methylase UbiE
MLPRTKEKAMPDPSPSQSHDAHVSSQFSSQARSYLASEVHAKGPDLEELARRVGRQPDAVALDLGCGAGHTTFRLAPLVKRVVAYDLSEAMLAVVAEEATRRGLGNVAAQRGSVDSLPYPAASFDVVVTRHSAHHWADPRAGVREMRRVLRPGGQAFVMDSVAPPTPLLDTWLQALELLRDPSHVRNHSVGEWKSMLSDAGFRVLETKGFRLRIDFASWIARMRTPEAHVTAIRSLQQCAAAEVAKHYAFEPDGTFMLDTALLVADAAGER